MSETLEITFDDLNSKAQREVLEFYGYDSPEVGNLDLVPLFVLEKEEENEKEG
jgi:hypothetical protein